MRCTYERHEAIRILYGALGVELDFMDPLKSYWEFAKIRDLEWLEQGLDSRAL